MFTFALFPWDMISGAFHYCFVEEKDDAAKQNDGPILIVLIVFGITRYLANHGEDCLSSISTIWIQLIHATD